MAFNIGITIDAEHKKFIEEHKLSPSALMRDKINEIIQTKDPELYQAKIKNFEKETKEVEVTDWQKRLNNEKDFNKRKLISFEFMDSIGMDTSDWGERIKIEKEIENAKLELQKGSETGEEAGEPGP